MSLVILCIAACSEKSVEIDYSGPTDDWRNYGKEAGGGHYSRANQITPENVAYCFQ